MRRYEFLLALLLSGGAAVLAGCGGAEPATPTIAPTAAVTGQQLAVLEELTELIRSDYLFADLGGVDWSAESAAVRHEIEAGLDDQQFSQALSELVSQLPEGTAGYTSRAERIQAELEASAVYEGIGAFVAVRGEPNSRIILLSVIQNSPAEQAGLQPHDAIYAVDGIPVTADEGQAVIDRVRGPAGTEVVLEVVSPAQEPRAVRVRRGQVTIVDGLRGALLTPSVAYALVPVTADASVAESLAGLLQSGAEQDPPLDGLVLDLRIAGSGGQWPLAEMLTLLSDGELGYYYSRTSEQPVVVAGLDIGGSQTIDLVVLIGPDTRGSPEIFAGALQARGRAALVGMPTEGAILSFRRQTLDDGSLLIFAESSYVTPAGQDLSQAGLRPDFSVEADWDEIVPGDDPVIRTALNLLIGE